MVTGGSDFISRFGIFLPDGSWPPSLDTRIEFFRWPFRPRGGSSPAGALMELQGVGCDDSSGFGYSPGPQSRGDSHHFFAGWQNLGHSERRQYHQAMASGHLSRGRGICVTAQGSLDCLLAGWAIAGRTWLRWHPEVLACSVESDSKAREATITSYRKTLEATGPWKEIPMG